MPLVPILFLFPNKSIEYLMRPRQEVTEIFSTFVQFESDHSKWVTDVSLLRSMRYCLDRFENPTLTDCFWVLYWHRIWQEECSNPANLHLLAYLQEPCYWAAEQTAKRLRLANVSHSLSDCFQFAIADAHKVLKGFNPERGSTLKTYARITFSCLLRDILLQRREANICTHWTLLRCKVGKKVFSEALKKAGLSSDEIAQHKLAWVCFKKLYGQPQLAPSENLPNPEQNLWIAIANLYNTERLSQLASPGLACSPEAIEQWLTRCAAWVRAYLYPPVHSLTPSPEQESGDAELPVPALASESLLDELSAQEEAQVRQSQQGEINQVLEASIQALDPKSQEILKLYYNQQLTQQEIAQRLEISQPTVFRRLTKAKEALLAAVLNWSQASLNKSVDSNLVQTVVTVLEEWLCIHYSEADRASTSNRGI